MIAIILAAVWCAVGHFAGRYWWRYDFGHLGGSGPIIWIVTPLFGPLAWLIGWLIHGRDPYIKH